MLDLMHASNTFGHGIGERKLKKIMSVYPDIIKLYQDYDQDDIINKIKEIEGFDIKTAEYFTTGLDNFIDLFNNLTPDMRKKLRLSIIKFQEEQEEHDNAENKFIDKTIVFSGFRNKEWEKIIESHGGKIGSTISSKTSLLVTTLKDIEEGSNSKIIKANELKIPILTKEQFESQYMN
jgi:NAD-dependent DNA ligase